jgi:hypothetical protein
MSLLGHYHNGRNAQCVDPRHTAWRQIEGRKIVLDRGVTPRYARGNTTRGDTMEAALTKEFTPKEVGELTGIHPDFLRDWRRQGFLDVFGKDGAGGWRYSQHDLVALWMSERLSGRGMNIGRKAALNWGYGNAGDVIVNIRRATAGLAPMGNRFAAILWDGNDSDGRVYGSTLVRLLAIGQLDEYVFDHAEIVDLFRLAATAPAEIVAAVNGEA